MNVRALIGAVLTLLALSLSATSRAQTAVEEDFTGTRTNAKWYFFNGACLTAGTATSTSSPDIVPGCNTVLGSYYSTRPDKDAAMVGGAYGYLGDSTKPSSAAAQVADPNGNGALRFTNGSSYGHNESGAIVQTGDGFPTGAGVQITFKTLTYRGNSGGNGATGAAHQSDGADGISFFLMDATATPGIGSFGGSLGYSCSNTNAPYEGLGGGYLGLGIDEFGNFLNGTNNTLGVTNPQSLGDNTATGGGQFANRIGLRGAGSVSWATLNAAYGTNIGSSSPYYPTSLAATCTAGTLVSGSCASCGTNGSGLNGAGTSCSVCPSNTTYYPGNNKCYSPCASGYAFNSGTGKCLKTSSPNKGTAGTTNFSNQTTAAPTTTGTSDLRTAAVKLTCSTGLLYNYSASGVATAVGNADLDNPVNTKGIMDYPAIQNAWQTLPTGLLIANESAVTRADAQPIVYSLKITQDGLLSLSYSFNGGSSTPIITGQDIKASNGPLPANFRFGFAGSTGGSTNVHEILCFKAGPSSTSNSSGSVNVYQDPTVKTGTQIFLAYYFPSDWAGQLTAQSVAFDSSTNKVVVNTTPTWDARCVLTGVNAATGACSTGATSMGAEDPTKQRVMITWNGSTGIPFQWGSLSTAAQTALTVGDATSNSNRLLYLRGDRTNEIDSTGKGLFRKRDSVLGDIIDSSPMWVGPPQLPYSMTTWVDQLHPTTVQPENSGETYADYQSTKQTRMNVVYVGANDGFLHGFRAGTLDANGNLVTTAAAPNDGLEVLAYMPGVALQNIHPVDSNGKLITQLDYSNSQYAHNYFVDATPATGDVFYNDGSGGPSGGATWHTWLVGGLGAGGAAIYALNVTDPSATGFTESNASKIVIGEWTPANLTCINNPQTPCGPNLGNTYGTPQIRRFHNGQWGAIFGNGYGTANGASGIYIMLIDGTGKPSFYYLATSLTPSAATPNGISSPSSLDVDLDHTVDYIYAGDLQGNVWRFDVTATDPMSWKVSDSSPLYKGGAAQPITTRLTVGTLKTIDTRSTLAGTTFTNEPMRVIINFGTGRMIPQTLSSATQYASGQQYLYGLWDWDMKNWSTVLSPANTALYLDTATIAGPGTGSNLAAQTITTDAAAGTRTVTHNAVCYVGATNCTTGSTTYMGWYIALPAKNEQIIFDPVLSPEGELVVNTYVPSPDSILSCKNEAPTGWSLGVEPDSGEGSPIPFFAVNGSTSVDGVQLNGVGIPSFVSSGQAADSNSEYFLTQATGGPATPTKVNRHVIVSGKRLNWMQRR